ncbi:hypothetical protein Fot_13860 [Forsythia ovata]|uniref:Uncharacterized protein n=1 Tax=Forsythia ovata TaxID=205694 RepID=A0ABD1W4Y1_9LAMI
MNSPQNKRGSNFDGNSRTGRGYSFHHNPQVYVASLDVVRDEAWYVDSGASHHVTLDVRNLEILVDYKGKGKLNVGNESFGEPPLALYTKKLEKMYSDYGDSQNQSDLRTNPEIRGEVLSSFEG